MLKISIIKCLSDNYSYLLKDENTNTVGVVDPSEFAAVDKEIKKKYRKLDFILNTHHHADHIGGNLELKEKYNSKIVCSFDDKATIKNTDINLNDGDIFSFGKTDFRVIHIPGHTLGHIAFYSKMLKLYSQVIPFFRWDVEEFLKDLLNKCLIQLKKLKNYLLIL